MNVLSARLVSNSEAISSARALTVLLQMLPTVTVSLAPSTTSSTSPPIPSKHTASLISASHTSPTLSAARSTTLTTTEATPSPCPIKSRSTIALPQAQQCLALVVGTTATPTTPPPMASVTPTTVSADFSLTANCVSPVSDWTLGIPAHASLTSAFPGTTLAAAYPVSRLIPPPSTGPARIKDVAKSMTATLVNAPKPRNISY